MNSIRKKIILIGSFPPPFHGSSIYLKNITELLSKEKEYKIITINCSDRKYDLSNMGKWSFSNVYYALEALILLIYNLISKKTDLVYIPISQNTLAFLRDGIYILISKIFGAKVIIHLHGSYFFEFYEKSSNIYKKFIDFTMKFCNGAIVLGEKLKYIFEKWFNDEKIFVLPNFVYEIKIEKDLSDINSAKDNKCIRITYLSNIVESKGIFQLLEAVKFLKNKGYNFTLNIAGKVGKDPITKVDEKETEERLKSYLKKYEDFIRYLGPINNPSKKYQLLRNSTDIFVLPSWYWYEGQPLVILEAMACSLPIVSTRNCGVIDETVIDGYNGILVEKKNVEQLAIALEKLVLDSDLRKKMGENSYKRYIENYTPEVHLRKFKEIIRTVLNG